MHGTLNTTTFLAHKNDQATIIIIRLVPRGGKTAKTHFSSVLNSSCDNRGLVWQYAIGCTEGNSGQKTTVSFCIKNFKDV